RNSFSFFFFFPPTSPPRVAREPSCGNSETEGKAATGSGERARVASEFQIRGFPYDLMQVVHFHERNSRGVVYPTHESHHATGKSNRTRQLEPPSTSSFPAESPLI